MNTVTASFNCGAIARTPINKNFYMLADKQEKVELTTLAFTSALERRKTARVSVLITLDVSE